MAVRQLHDTKHTLKCLAFSPDGSLLAAGGYRGVVQLWDASTGQLRGRLVGLGNRVQMVAFTSADSVVAASPKFHVWEVRGKSGRIEGTDVLESVRYARAALSPDGRTLFAGHYVGGGYSFWQALRFPGGERIWTGERVEYQALPVALALGPGGRTLYCGYDPRQPPGSIRAFDAATGADRGEVAQCAGGLTAMAVSPDGRRLACCAGENLQLFALDQPAKVAGHRPGRTHFLAVAFHPSGDFFATANGDGKIDYWGARTGEHRQAFDWGVGKLQDVVFDPTGDRAACCSKSGKIVVWDVDR
jgi:WD40 repeat protein